MTIYLQHLLQDAQGWGHVQGYHIREHLQTSLEMSPYGSIIRISLKGVERIDVVFARTSVVELAEHERGRRGLCLLDVPNQDILDNIDGAAQSRKQPLFIWTNETCPHLVGPEPGVGLHPMLQYVLSVSATRANVAARILGLHIPNASNKLRQLWQKGYILRQELGANSGGKEYSYLRIA